MEDPSNNQIESSKGRDEDDASQKEWTKQFPTHSINTESQSDDDCSAHWNNHGKDRDEQIGEDIEDGMDAPQIDLRFDLAFSLSNNALSSEGTSDQKAEKKTEDGIY